MKKIAVVVVSISFMTVLSHVVIKMIGDIEILGYSGFDYNIAFIAGMASIGIINMINRGKNS